MHSPSRVARSRSASVTRRSWTDPPSGISRITKRPTTAATARWLACGNLFEYGPDPGRVPEGHPHAGVDGQFLVEREELTQQG